VGVLGARQQYSSTRSKLPPDSQPSQDSRPQGSTADIFTLVHDWLREDKYGPWLLVIDNADDPAVLAPLPSNSSDNGGSSLQQHLSRYLPQSKHGSVLVTSRTKRVAMQIVEGSDVIPIEPMHDAAAHALLCKKLGAQGGDDGIAELATALDHMPLALAQAAAYIRERVPRYSVQQYLEEYRKSDRNKTSLLNQQAGHLRRDGEASNSVLITWQISFDYIQRIRRSAADLLSLMSFFDRQGIQDYLLRNYSGVANKRKRTEEEEGEDEERVKERNNNDDVEDKNDCDDEFEKDVVTLRDYSFITVTVDPDTFEMHSLVQLATRKWLQNQGQLDKWRGLFISNLCAEMPTGEYENWVKCQALFPHMQAAWAQQPKDGETREKWAQLMYRAGWYAWRRGRANEAEQMSTVAMEVMIEILGEENINTLKSMQMVGNARELGGKYNEAETIHRKTLALKRKVQGPEHPTTLNTISNLAGVLGLQGKYQEAEALYRQILAQREKVLSPKHPHILIDMGNLALGLRKQGKYKEAEAMNRQTLAQKEKIFGPEHPETLIIRSNLAQVLNSQGKYREAEAIFRQTLAQKEKVLGPEHPSTLISMGTLAQVLNIQGKYKEAEAIIRQTLAQREKVLSPKHPDILIDMGNLALALENQGRYKEAEAMNRQTLAQKEKVLGPEHPSTLISMNNLGIMLRKQGKYEESIALLERACTGHQNLFGEDHPKTRACNQNYKDALASQKQEHLTLSPNIVESSASRQ
jgi:tetratricopeptide (TPR) repeat protein